MGKRIIFLLFTALAIFVMIQNNASVWVYIITLGLIMVIWSMFE